MKRWVIVLLVALAVVVLVSPGIVGRLAERNLESNLEWAAQETGDAGPSGGSFDRGWFTSEGTRRIEIRNEPLRSLIADLADTPAAAEPPALIITTRLDHGLIPVTSMARESGSLAPALASAVSTLALDPGHGEPVALPGEVVTRIGLSGASTSHYRLDAGSVDDGSMHVEWSGADVTVRTDPAEASLGFEAAIEPLAIRSAEDSLSIGRIDLDGEQKATPYGFNVGSVDAEVEAVAIGMPDAPTSGFGRLSLEADAGIAEDRVNGRSSLSVRDIDVPGFGNVSLEMAVAVERFDAASLQAILAALEQAQASAAPDEALAATYPAIRDDVRRFLAAGAELRVERFELLLPQGAAFATLRLELPETDPAGFSWPAVLLALNASADLSLPAAVVDMAQAANPQAGALVAMGILKKEGDVYRLHADYAQGLLTVNGAPMSIPLPAAR